MDTLHAVLRRIACTSRCRLGPPQGSPGVPLPSEATEFYRLCGGAVLFRDKARERSDSFRIRPPEELAFTDVLLNGGEPPEEPTGSEGWVVIADDFSPSYVSLDTTPGPRYGWLYDTAFGYYGSPGDCPVIAHSLTDFLTRTLDFGGLFYWLEPDFESLGDAYDDNLITPRVPEPPISVPPAYPYRAVIPELREFHPARAEDAEIVAHVLVYAGEAWEGGPESALRREQMLMVRRSLPRRAAVRAELARHAGHPSPGVRLEAARALRLDDPGRGEALLRSLAGLDGPVGEQARAALAEPA